MSEGGCRQGPEGARDARRPGRKPFLLEVRQRIATLTFDRPPVNVLDIKTLREMTAALKRVVGREDVGEHRAGTVHAMIRVFHDFCRALLEFPRPTVARVHGAALGGGCEVVLCCDVAVAAASARLGLPEIALGVFPPLAAVLLPRLAGRAAARLVLLGEELEAETALRLGVVSEVVPDERLGERVLELAARAAGLSSAALSRARLALRRGSEGPFEDALRAVETIYLRFVAACTALLLTIGVAMAASGHEDRAGPAGDGWRIEYGDKGLEFTSPGGGWSFEPEFRLQFRYSEPFDDLPRTADDLRVADESDFELNRSRFKLDAQLGARWLTLYTETELDGPVLLDFRFTIEPSERFGVRVGQWKPEYSRERRDSSGAQTFVDRSIVNREFTLDRQQGVMALGRIQGRARADVSWWAGVFGGAGRGRSNDGGDPLVLTRLQWNPFGRVLDFSQSDIGRRAEPAGSVAFAAAHNRSRYTRFSSDGGGQLDGYGLGDVDQYEIDQILIETALHWRGLAWQQEWHRKRVRDRILGGTQSLEGLYAQLSYFPSERWPWWPRPLEVGARFATVDPDKDAESDRRNETTFVANWFFDGHRNKLSIDLSRLEMDDPGGAADRWRWRAQWDVSF